MSRLTMVVGAHLILRKGRKVLLARRFNTGFGDGYYNFPCGHLDPSENVANAMVREAKEEINVRIAKKDLKFVGTTHWLGEKQSVNFFFECKNWKCDIVNNEPHKCDDVAWFDLDKLPRKMLKQTRLALKAYKKSKDAFFIEAQD